MGRPKRADEAGGIYRSLNRGNTRSTIFHKPEDYDAFEQILAAGPERHACRILALPVNAQSLAFCAAAYGRWRHEQLPAVGFAHAHEKNDYGSVGRVSRPDRSVIPILAP